MERFNKVHISVIKTLNVDSPTAEIWRLDSYRRMVIASAELNGKQSHENEPWISSLKGQGLIALSS